MTITRKGQSGHAQRTASRGHAHVSSISGHLIYCLMSALLLALAFPWPGWGILAHVALVPMVVLALRSDSGKRVAWTSFIVAAVWWVWMVRWLWPVTGGVGVVSLSLYLGAYWPVFLLAIRWLDRKYRPACVLSVPLVWMSLELVRGHIMEGGFDWMGLGHTQAPFHSDHAAGRLIQIADIFGMQGVTFLVAMTSGVIVDLLTRPIVKPTASGKGRYSRTVRAAVLVWLGVYTGAWGYGQYRISQTADMTTAGPRFATIQTNVLQNNKDSEDPEQQEKNWKELLALTLEVLAADPQIDVVVWPETHVPRPVNEEAVGIFLKRAAKHNDMTVDEVQSALAAQGIDWGRYRHEISALAAEHQVAMLIGSGTLYEEQGKPVYHNSVYMVLEDGRYSPVRYDKMHRVPFGEYIPWVDRIPSLKDWFIRTFTPFDYDYSVHAGREYAVFDFDPGYDGSRPTGLGAVLAGVDDNDAVAGHGPRPLRIVTPICFEDTVPRHCRRLIVGEDGEGSADILVNVTNDGWFTGSWQPWQHLQIAVFRSIEHRIPSVRSVNTGVSGFIDSTGRIHDMVVTDGRSQDVAGAAVSELRLDPRRTVFARVGQWPLWGLAMATLLWILAGAMRRDKIRRNRS